MAETLTLEEIAGRHDIVLLDTNVISYPTNFKQDDGFEYYFDTDKPEKLAKMLKEFSKVYDVLINNPNVCASPQISQEFKRLKKQARKEMRAQKKHIKRVEIFSREGRFSRLGADRINKDSGLLIEIYEKLEHILGRVGERCIKPDERIYLPMRDIMVYLAREIELFSDKISEKYKFKNQKNTNDECIIAHAFALALKKRGNIALLSGDGRVPILTRAAYNVLYSEDFSPII